MKNNERKEQRSGIIKYCVTTISCLLLFCVAYIYLIFGTDVVINIDDQSSYNPANVDRISVSTVISDVEENEPGINDGDDGGGNGGSNPPPPGVPDPGPVSPIPADETVKKVYKFLSSLGYTDAMCAGIMGNIYQESSMSFGAVQKHADGTSTDWTDNAFCNACSNIAGTGYAHGLCQWDAGRRNTLLQTAAANGVEWTDANLQFQYMESEIKGSYYSKWCDPNNLMNDRTNEDEVEYACYRWCRFYEACAGVKSGDTYASRVNYDNWDKRLKYARGYYAGIQQGLYN